ncbi:D-alanine--D-alanine ligase [Candidatus Aerophobetes bacterium]|nr:D-alanine--D-alanine ligase [Candidatus Aerophobetes bacterium]
MREKPKVCVLKGGRSPEREISLKSGEAVEKALKKAGYRVTSLDPKDKGFINSLQNEKTDVVFIALHGPEGEDGKIQGLLEILNIPYTGSGVLASAIAMDKSFSRKIWNAEGLVQPRYEIAKTPSFSCNIEPPLIVKPAKSGSTLGVSIVKDPKDIGKAIKKAFQLDREVILIEEYIKGREITVGIIDDPEPRALPIIEIIPAGEIYDYTTKYTKGLSRYLCPAPFSPQECAKIKEVAIKAYRAIGCRDFARVDMIWKEKEVYLLEINTIPGMTDLSLLPLAARVEGIEFPELVDKIVKMALKRKKG